MEVYVLQVISGEEEGVIRSLKRAGYTAYAPSETRLERRGGGWHKRERIIFTGYVFLAVEKLDAEGYYTAKNDNFVIRFLGNEKPEKLQESEMEMILAMANNGKSIPVPVISFDKETKTCKVDWDLKDQPLMVKRLFVRQKRAVFEVEFAGKKHDIMLSCQIKEV